MNEALWLLLKLRFTAFLRRIGRGMKTVKGVILTVIISVSLITWAGSLVFGVVAVRTLDQREMPVIATTLGPDGQFQTAQVGTRIETRPDPEKAARWIALGLLAYTILLLVTGAGEQMVVFSAPEVNLLFPGPFTRRELLAYKLIQPTLLALPFVLFMGTTAAMFSGTLIGAYVGLWLAVEYLQLLAVAVFLTGEWLGQWAARWGRRGALVALLLVAGAGLALAWRAVPDPDQSPVEFLLALEESAPVRAVLVPMYWFANVFAARDYGPMFGSAALALAFDLALLALVFMLDSRFLETATATSAKAYAKLERMRAGSLTAAFAAPTGKPRFSLPTFPDWRGAGPVMWRQMLAGLRSLKGMSIFITIVVGSSVLPLALAHGLSERQGRMPPEALAAVLTGIIGMLSLMVTQAVAFDFRSDYERMDTLKALPANPAAIVIGQLTTPVLLQSLLQTAAFVLIALFVPKGAFIPLTAAAFVLPVNVFSLGVDNLLFLIYPTRLVKASPGDMRTGLRQALTMLVKMACLLVAAGAACGVAALVFFVLGRSWPLTLAAGWLVLAAASVPVVPLCAAAFRKFDVSRELG